MELPDIFRHSSFSTYRISLSPNIVICIFSSDFFLEKIRIINGNWNLLFAIANLAVLVLFFSFSDVELQNKSIKTKDLFQREFLIFTLKGIKLLYETKKNSKIYTQFDCCSNRCSCWVHKSKTPIELFYWRSCL